MYKATSGNEEATSIDPEADLHWRWTDTMATDDSSVGIYDDTNMPVTDDYYEIAEDFDLGYAVLNDDDEQTLLNLIDPEWIYVELKDKKTGNKAIHKMYASDKEWNVYHLYQDNQNNWHEVSTEFSFSLVEE